MEIYTGYNCSMITDTGQCFNGSSNMTHCQIIPTCTASSQLNDVTCYCSSNIPSLQLVPSNCSSDASFPCGPDVTMVQTLHGYVCKNRSAHLTTTTNAVTVNTITTANNNPNTANKSPLTNSFGEEKFSTLPPPQTLQELSARNLSSSQPRQLSENVKSLAYLTLHPSHLSAKEVDLAAGLIYRALLAIKSASPAEMNQSQKLEIVEYAASTIDNVMNIDTGKVTSSFSSTLRQSLEILETALKLQDNTSVQFDRVNFATIVTCPGVLANQWVQALQQKDGILTLTVTQHPTTKRDAQRLSTFYMPRSAVECATAALNMSQTRLCSVAQTAYTVFLNDKIFKDTSLTDITAVGSSILAARVGVQRRLTLANSSVNMTFELPRNEFKETTDNVTCVYWETETDQWRSEGCQLLRWFSPSDGINSRVVCECNHLTSFSVLVSRKALSPSVISVNDTGSNAENVLTVISYVGCGISTVSLIASMTMILIFRSLRTRQHYHLIFGLSTTLAIVYVLVSSAMDASRLPHGVCQAVAAVLHYLLLLSFLWTSAVATLLYTKMVDVFGHDEPSLIKRLYAMVFGIPTVIVAASMASTRMEAYASPKLCWIHSQAVFYAAFISPMLLTVSYNIVILVIVVSVLRGRKRATGRVNRIGRDTSSIQYLLGTVVSLSLILGVSWLTSTFVLSHGHIAFEYVFIICNVLQSSMIFLNISRDKEVRNSWCGTSPLPCRTPSAILRPLSRWRRPRHLHLHKPHNTQSSSAPLAARFTPRFETGQSTVALTTSVSAPSSLGFSPSGDESVMMVYPEVRRDSNTSQLVSLSGEGGEQ